MDARCPSFGKWQSNHDRSETLNNRQKSFGRFSRPEHTAQRDDVRAAAADCEVRETQIPKQLELKPFQSVQQLGYLPFH